MAQDHTKWIRSHRYLLLGGLAGGLLDADHVPALFAIDFPALGDRPWHALGTALCLCLTLALLTLLAGWIAVEGIKQWLAEVTGTKHQIPEDPWLDSDSN